MLGMLGFQHQKLRKRKHASQCLTIIPGLTPTIELQPVDHRCVDREVHRLLALRTFLGPFFVACFAACAMLKCSSFLPDLSAAASQSGVSPRPAQVSLGFSG